MSSIEAERLHRTVSDDGTEIVGRVTGQGPPVVFVHGAVADGESEWAALVPLLSERFTCYLPSTRGRGRSGEHPDHSVATRVGDLVRFVERLAAEVGAPVGLVGASGGGLLALGVAARTPAVSGLVAYEPPRLQLLSDERRAEFHGVLDRMDAALREGRGAEVALPFAELIANDEEYAALTSDPAAMEELAAYVPVDLVEIRAELDHSGPHPTDPGQLARITAPTLLLRGSATPAEWLVESTHYAAAHIPGASIREIAGNGHLGHLLHPDRVAAELAPFLASALAPGSAA